MALHTLFLENEAQINKTNYAMMLFMSKQVSLLKIALDPAKINIGTQCVQELFFVIGAFLELFTVTICLSFSVAMYSKKETGNL